MHDEINAVLKFMQNIFHTKTLSEQIIFFNVILEF